MKKIVSLLLILCLLLAGACTAWAEEACVHENQAEVESLEIEKVVSYDAEGHKLQGSREYTQYCMDCGEELDWGITENYTWTEKHSFEEGVCTVCEYVNACLHKETRTDTTEGWSCDELDQENHVRITDKHVSTLCLTCGETISYEETEVSRVTEKHTFDEEGTCTECGYESTVCLHDQDLLETNDLSIQAVVAQAELTHTLKGTCERTVYCMDCGEKVEHELIENYEWTEKHSFEEGVCTVCEYVNTCPHEETRTDTTEGWSCDELNRKNHVRITSKHVSTLCLTCGETISYEETEVSRVTEKHTFDEDDICTECGYEKTASASDEDSSVPKTGDRSHAAVLWAMGLSALCLIALALRRRAVSGR